MHREQVSGIQSRSLRLRSRGCSLLAALTILGVTMSFSPVQARERVVICPFEGPRGAQLRWRVSSVVKKARHTSLRYRPPPADASDARLVRYARRRIIDAFIFGTVEQDDDDGSWTLSLVIKGPDAEILDDTLVYRGDTLRKMVKTLKREGKIDLREAVLPYEDEDEDKSDLEPLSIARARANNGSSNVDSPGGPTAAPATRPDSDDDPDPAADVDLDIDLDAKRDDSSATAAGSAAKPQPAESKSGKKRLQALFGLKTQKSQKAKKSRTPKSADDNWDESEDDSTAFKLNDPQLASSDELLVADVAYSPSDKGMPLLRFGIGGGLVARELAYVDNVYGRLRDQSAAAWVYRLEAELFPFAAPLNDRVSVVAGFESNMAGTVNDDSTGEDYGVKFSEYFAGLRVMQPIGHHALRGQVTFGKMNSGLDDSSDTLNVPDFEYSLIRASFAGIFNIGSLSLQAYAGYQMPVGYGEVGQEEWFPRIEGEGFETGASLSYPLSGKVSLAVGTSLRRLNLNMNAEPEDAVRGLSEVAGGATDTYISGRAGLTISL